MKKVVMEALSSVMAKVADMVGLMEDGSDGDDKGDG